VTNASTLAIETSYRTVDGVRVRFAESPSSSDRPILMFNPWPESLLAFEPVWRALSSHSHVVAVDLPGFGKSERRDELLSAQRMSEFIISVIEAWPLDAPHVVAPDVGTPASLFAAARHPGSVSSLVVGTGATAYPLQVAGALQEMLDAPNLDGMRAADGRDIVAGAIAGMEGHTLPEEIREDYLSSYEGDRFVESAAYVRSYPQDLPVLAGLLGEISTPVQIIAGRRDSLVPPANAELLHEALPHSKLDILDAGHFTWEDAADQYAALVTTWWSGGYATTGSAAARK
jgi:pimeloyl-ACP methyl ester carboxylesterase